MPTRRGYLGAVATAAAVGLAGCPGDASEATPTGTPTPAREPYRLEPGEHETIVIFRNDDPQPGYEPEALRAVEEVFVDAGVPLTHAVIPAADGEVDPGSEFCGRFRSLATRYPGLFEFALHGYTHTVETTFYGASEFGGLGPDQQGERVRDGLAALEACSEERPTTFVPPFNTYDDVTVDTLRSVGLPVVSGGWWFTDDYYGRPGPFETDGVLHVPVTHDVATQYDPPALYSLEHLRATFDDAHGDGGLYVPMLHYQHFTSEARLETLRSFVDYVADHDGVGFTTLGAFGTAYLAGDLQRTDGAWRYDP